MPAETPTPAHGFAEKISGAYAPGFCFASLYVLLDWYDELFAPFPLLEAALFEVWDRVFVELPPVFET